MLGEGGFRIMRFTEHTALKAAEQISEGVALSEIEETELSSLIALCEAELRERDRNIAARFNQRHPTKESFNRVV
jgi:hypothetical protein